MLLISDQSLITPKLSIESLPGHFCTKSKPAQLSHLYANFALLPLLFGPSSDSRLYDTFLVILRLSLDSSLTLEFGGL